MEEASDAIERIRQWRLQRGLAVDFPGPVEDTSKQAADREAASSASAPASDNHRSGYDYRQNDALPATELHVAEQPEASLQQQQQQQLDASAQRLLGLMRRCVQRTPGAKDFPMFVPTELHAHACYRASSGKSEHQLLDLSRLLSQSETLELRSRQQQLLEENLRRFMSDGGGGDDDDNNDGGGA